MKLKGIYQHNAKDCGAACLLTLIKYYKGNNTFENIRYLTKCDNFGITALNLVNASTKLGFKVTSFKCNYDSLEKIVKPAICHVTINDNYNHYIILEKIVNNKIYVFDPWIGKKKYSKEEFIKIWNNIVFELIPERKLDNVDCKLFPILKNILSINKYLYIKIIILSIISISLVLVSNYYFKIILEKNTINVLLFFLVIIILKEITDYIRNILTSKLEYNVDEYININTCSKLLTLPYYYFNSRTTGDIMSKIQDLNYLKDLFIKLPIFLFIDLSLLILSSIILININVYLFLLFIVLCIIYLLVILLFNNKKKKMIRINQEDNAINNEILIENIKSINTIKNLNIIDHRFNIYKDKYNIYLKDNKKYEKLVIIENFIKNIILFIGINIILYVGMNNVYNNILNLGDLILFNSIMLYFIDPLKSICDLSPLLKNGINALKRVNEIYLFKNNSKIDNIINNYDISIRNLSFSYNNYDYIFNNLNLEIREKEKIAIMGSSGCGKSTLFKLINKTYEINNNKIFIGNTDINKINVNDYLIYVSQDESLFNESLYYNLTLNLKVSIDEINKVSKITGLDKVMKNKNIDLYNIIEEEGTNFSKGERQKIILTRVLLRNSNILILDESLNGVEEHEERKILKNIINIYNNKTIIYVTHRKESIKLFDRVINLKKEVI